VTFTSDRRAAYDGDMASPHVEAKIRALRREVRTLPSKTQYEISAADGVSFGVVVKKRQVGGDTVWLSFRKPDRVWWISWTHDGENMRMGYEEPRVTTCWTVFFELTSAQMRALENEARIDNRQPS
jgi:hypothetical protein